MAKSSLATLLLLTTTVGDHLTLGQSTTGECSHVEQHKYYSDALFAIVNTVESEFRNLKTQISRMDDRVKRQKLSGYVY